MATENVEDYLERIEALIETKGYARVVEIAEALGLAQASVTQMVQKLGERGYVVYEKYRGLTLTPEGERVAKTIKRRHRVLTDFFKQLGINEEAVKQDIEGMEHHLSPSTLSRIEDLVDFFRQKPHLLDQLNEYRRVAKR